MCHKSLSLISSDEENEILYRKILSFIHDATLTPYGLFGIGRPAKKILTE
jgi:hypothetical protein